MNPSLRRHPTLILVLTAVLAWPWSAALAVFSSSGRAADSPSASASSGQAGKPGRHDPSRGATLSPALDDSDDGDGFDSEALFHLIAADRFDSPAMGPILRPSSRAGMALPPPPRPDASPFRLLC